MNFDFQTIFDESPFPIIFYSKIDHLFSYNKATLNCKKEAESITNFEASIQTTFSPHTAQNQSKLILWKEIFFETKIITTKDAVIYYLCEKKDSLKSNFELQDKLSKQGMSLNESSYRNLVETSSSFIYKADFMGNFIFINEIGVKKLGYPKEEIIGVNFSFFIAPDWKEQVADFYKSQFKEKKKESYLEFPIITKQGHKIWIGQTVQMIDDNDWVLGFQAFASDITDRKILEFQLDNQRALLNTMLNNIPLNVYLKTLDGEYVFINEKLNSEAIHHKSETISFLKNFDYLDEAIWKEGKQVVVLEKVILNGKQKYFIVGKEIITDKLSSQPMMLGYTYDITERKMIEEDLKKAKKRAEKSIVAKEKFISIMSHEIRTPMNAIIGVNHLLLQMPHSNEQKDYFLAVKTASDNLLKILNNILDISKLNSGNVSVESINFDVHKLITDIIAINRFKAAEKNILLSIELEKQVPKVIKGDGLKLHQILTNLISNALKFTHEGSVVLKVSILEQIKNQLIFRFEIIDTGIGIATDKQMLIFESFSQANSNTAQLYGGTGLGLAITKSLVELLRGEIEVESSVGLGAKFTVHLPYELTDEIVSSSEVNEHFSFEGLNILLVEDNEMNQLIVEKFLESKNVNLYKANHGKEAIEIILKHSIDIVLMDLQMPVMDGYETVKYIRKKLKISSSALPIIAITATSIDEKANKITKSGFEGLIIKPFEPNKLYKIISQYAASALNLDILKQKEIKTVKEENTITNLAYLKQSAGDSKEFVKNMVQIFLNQTPSYIEEIKQHHQAKQWQKLKAIVHKMKPTIAMMGIQLQKEIEEIEEIAKKEHQLEKLDYLLPILYKSSYKAIEELTKELTEHQ